MKIKKLLEYSFPIFLCVFLSSCFGLRVDARISASGKVEAQIQYSISVAALEFSKSDSNTLFLPLTVDRKAFSDRVLANSGELSSWSVQNKTDSYFVDARVSFPSMQLFCSFLDADKKMIRFDLTGNVNKLTIAIPEAKQDADPEFLKFLSTVFADDAIELSLELPRSPRSNNGFKVEKAKAVYSGTSTKFFSNKPGIILELSW